MKSAYVKPILHDGGEREATMLAGGPLPLVLTTIMGTKPLVNPVNAAVMVLSAVSPSSKAGKDFFMGCLPALEAVSS